MLVAAILAIASAKVIVRSSAANSDDIMEGGLDAKEEGEDFVTGTGAMEQMNDADAGDMENIDDMDSTQLEEKVGLLVELQEKESHIAELKGERLENVGLESPSIGNDTRCESRLDAVTAKLAMREEELETARVELKEKIIPKLHETIVHRAALNALDKFDRSNNIAILKEQQATAKAAERKATEKLKTQKALRRGKWEKYFENLEREEATAKEAVGKATAKLKKAERARGSLRKSVLDSDQAKIRRIAELPETAAISTQNNNIRILKEQQKLAKTNVALCRNRQSNPSAYEWHPA